MGRFVILIMREFWENRTAFVKIPCIIAGFLVVTVLLGYLGLEWGRVDVGGAGGFGWMDDEPGNNGVLESAMQWLHDEPLSSRKESLSIVYWSTSIPFTLVLWFVVFFYLIDCLYQDRRDRSILFWKSMPVSDLQTVIAKLVTALICVPAVYFLCMTVVQLLFLIFASIVMLFHAIPVWETLWQPSVVVLRVWGELVAYVLFIGLWGLPFYTWLTLVSSFAKSVPFVWVVGIPIAITTTESMVTNGNALARWMGEHMLPLNYRTLQVSDILSRILSIDLITTLAVSGLFVFGAVWFRGRADEL